MDKMNNREHTQPPLDEVVERIQKILDGEDISVDFEQLVQILSSVQLIIQGKDSASVSQGDIESLRSTYSRLQGIINGAKDSSNETPSGIVLPSGGKMSMERGNQREKLLMQGPKVVQMIDTAIRAMEELLQEKRVEEDKEVEAAGRFDADKFEDEIEHMEEFKEILDLRSSATAEFELTGVVLKPTYPEAATLQQGLDVVTRDFALIQNLLNILNDFVTRQLYGDERKADKEGIIRKIIQPKWEQLRDKLQEKKTELEFEKWKEDLEKNSAQEFRLFRFSRSTAQALEGVVYSDRESAEKDLQNVRGAIQNLKELIVFNQNKFKGHEKEVERLVTDDYIKPLEARAEEIEDKIYELWKKEIDKEVEELERLSSVDPISLSGFRDIRKNLQEELGKLEAALTDRHSQLPDTKKSLGKTYVEGKLKTARDRVAKLVSEQANYLENTEFGTAASVRNELQQALSHVNSNLGSNDVVGVLQPAEQRLAEKIEDFKNAVKAAESDLFTENVAGMERFIARVIREPEVFLEKIRQKIATEMDVTKTQIDNSIDVILDPNFDGTNLTAINTALGVATPLTTLKEVQNALKTNIAAYRSSPGIDNSAMAAKRVQDAENKLAGLIEAEYKKTGAYAEELVDKYCRLILIKDVDAISLKNKVLEALGNVKNEQEKAFLKIRITLHEIGFYGDTGQKDFSTYLAKIDQTMKDNEVTYLDIARALFVKRISTDPDEEISMEQLNEFVETRADVVFNEGAIEMWKYVVERIAGRVGRDPEGNDFDDDFSYKYWTSDKQDKLRKHLRVKFGNKIEDSEILDLMVQYCEEMGARSSGYIRWLARETTRSHGTPVDSSVKFSDEHFIHAPFAAGSYSRRRYGASFPDATSEDMLFFPPGVLELWNTGKTEEQKKKDMEEMRELQDIVKAYRETTWYYSEQKPQTIPQFIVDVRDLFVFDENDDNKNKINPDRSLFPIQGELAIQAIERFQNGEMTDDGLRRKTFVEIFTQHDPVNYNLAYRATDELFNIFKQPPDSESISEDEVLKKFREKWLTFVLGKGKLIPGRHQLLFGPFTVRYIHRLMNAYEFQHKKHDVYVLMKRLIGELESAGGVETLKAPDGQTSLLDYVRKNTLGSGLHGKTIGRFIYYYRSKAEKRYKLRLREFKEKTALGLAELRERIPESIRVSLPGDIADSAGSPIEVEAPWEISFERDTTGEAGAEKK